MQCSSAPSRRRALLLAVAAALGAATPAFADLWTRGGGNNLWSNGLNWQDGSAPGSGDSAVFPTPIPAGAATITMPNGAMAASLLFNDSYTLSGVSANLALSAAGIISVQPGKTGTLSIPLTANANVLTINGAGTLILNNASSRTANTNINDAVVHLNNAAALGTGPVNVSPNGTGGTFELNGGLNFVANVNLQPNGGLRVSGGQGTTGGTVNVSPSTTVKLMGGALATDQLKVGNFANGYTGGAGSTTLVSGPGTVFFLFSNNYAGNWQVDSGTLRFVSSSSLGTGTSAVVVNNGGTLQPWAITFSRPVTLNTGATLAGEDGPTVAAPVTVASGAAVTLALKGSPSTFFLGAADNHLTGGGAGSTIAVTSAAAGLVLQLNNSNNYTGNWSIGSNATVQIDANENLGNAANTVTMNGGTLRTTQDFSTPRTFATTGSTFDVIFASTLTMAAGIGSGSGTTSKTGNGILILAANSTRSGTIDIVGGEVVAQAPTALGSASVNIQAATLRVGSNTIGNSITMNSGSTLRGSGVAGSTGAITLSNTASSTFTIATLSAPDAFTVSGAITGGIFSSTMNFAGPGAVALNGAAANTFPGLTVVHGTLRLGKSVANGAIASNVSIEDGAGADILALDASEQIANGANVNLFGSGASFDLNGFNETIGTVTMTGGTITGGGGTLTLNGGVASGISTFSSSSTAQITANINLSGQARIINTQNGPAGPDIIIDGVISNGSLTKTNAGSMNMIGASANTYTGSTTINAGTLTLAKSAAGVTALPGDVTLGAQGAATLLIAQSEQIADPATLTIASGGTVQLLTFTETINNLTMTAGQVTGTGGTLGINGTLTTNASATTATITANVDVGGGTRTFSIADGTAANDLSISGNLSGAGGVIKTGAGLVSVKNVRVGTLDVQTGLMRVAGSGGASTSTSALNSLTITGSAQLDLTDNKLIVAGGIVGAWNGSNYTGVSGLIRSGRNGGVFPLWDGSGLVTSMSDATGNVLTTLAIATAGQAGKSIFGGQSVAPGNVLVMYTYGGDANLSGFIDADDYFQIDSNYGTTVSAEKSFFNGDFNYDGFINGDDYMIIDAGFSGQGTPLAAGAPAGVASVPEPASVAWLSVLACAVAGRRRRRRILF